MHSSPLASICGSRYSKCNFYERFFKASGDLLDLSVWGFFFHKKNVTRDALFALTGLGEWVEEVTTHRMSESCEALVVLSSVMASILGCRHSKCNFQESFFGNLRWPAWSEHVFFFTKRMRPEMPCLLWLSRGMSGRKVRTHWWISRVVGLIQHIFLCWILHLSTFYHPCVNLQTASDSNSLTLPPPPPRIVSPFWTAWWKKRSKEKDSYCVKRKTRILTLTV